MNLDVILYLLTNYFGVEKHLKSLAVVNCMDPSDNFKLLNNLFLHDIQVVNIRLNKHIDVKLSVDYLQSFSKSSNLMGVYLDYGCDFSDTFIQLVSLNLFNRRIKAKAFIPNFTN